MNANKRRRQLRSLITGPQPIMIPGIYDCLTARIVEQSGLPAAIVTGAGLTASVLGTPDFGMITMTEVVTQTRNIVNSVNIPIIADCDTGYGNPINVGRTIREFEAAGVSALFMEDQVAPKRCGHFEGKQVVPTEEMELKWHAAVDARVDDDLILIARTDARATYGIEEAVNRGRRYAEAGADAIFVEAPQTRDELAYVGRELAQLGKPLMVNLVEGGKTPLLNAQELKELGFSFVTYSGALQKSAIKTMQELLTALKRDGGVDAFYPSKMVSLEERSDILGLSEFYELEQRYESSIA